MATLHLKPLNLSTRAQNYGSPEKKLRALSAPPPIYLSTDPSHVDLRHLRSLLAATNQSGHRFPELLADGSGRPADPEKVAVALRRSFVVVSAFARRSSPLFRDDRTAPAERSPWRNWLEGVLPVTESNGRLVGFGRASSDAGLTASIHDVAVRCLFH